jgi:hypothetical protein
VTVPLACVDGVELPPASTAVTVKKYCCPAAKLPTVVEVPVNPVKMGVVPSAPELVPSKTLYDFVPLLGAQTTLSDRAPAAETWTPLGAAGTMVTSTELDTGEVPVDDTAAIANT